MVTGSPGQSDVTFLIPVNFDTTERGRNLFIIISYLTKHFDTNIIISEQNTNLVPEILKDFEGKYKYHRFQFLEPHNYHRTAQLNQMLEMAETRVVVNYDCDVIIHPTSYLHASSAIIYGNADVVYPYNGQFLNVPTSIIEEFAYTLDIRSFEGYKFKHMGPPDGSKGGAIYIDRQKYIDAGGENEGFVGWGPEDEARYFNFNKLGYNILRLDYPLFHLSHPAKRYENPHYEANCKLAKELMI